MKLSHLAAHVAPNSIHSSQPANQLLFCCFLISQIVDTDRKQSAKELPVVRSAKCGNRATCYIDGHAYILCLEPALREPQHSEELPQYLANGKVLAWSGRER